MRLLIVTAVEREAAACAALSNSVVVAGGIGRTNAAIATTRSILEQGPFDAVLSMGVAGSLPGSGLAIGDVVVGSSAIYMEEGIETPMGFGDMSSLGFSLGDFEGNTIQSDPALYERLASLGRCGPIATVATCSGTDLAAERVHSRTGAIAEAMEGAAVLHAGRSLALPGIEVRTISNSTGDRDNQQWNLDLALESLTGAAGCLNGLLRRD